MKKQQKNSSQKPATKSTTGRPTLSERGLLKDATPDSKIYKRGLIIYTGVLPRSLGEASAANSSKGTDSSTPPATSSPTPTPGSEPSGTSSPARKPGAE